MFVSSLRVSNYKSYADSGVVALGPEFNVIVGPNNAGKTAFIQGLRTSKNPKIPHRDLTLRREAVSDPECRFELAVTLTADEAFDEFMAQAGDLWIPVPLEGSDQPEILADEILRRSGVTVTTTFIPNGQKTPKYPSHRRFVHPENVRQRAFKIVPSADKQTYTVSAIQNTGNDSLTSISSAIAARKIFVFEAERLRIASTSLSSAPQLATDAANLPRALFELQLQDDAWNEFNGHVNRILPSVKRVAVAAPHGETNIEVRLWPVSPQTRRDDLVVSLSDSGTGVGQVLAILCAAMTSTKACIAIDEPGNFLHPGAVKALIGILKQFDHQYVITTHSLDALISANPNSVLVVDWSDCVSTIREANVRNVDEHKRLLESIGVSLADLFGMEAVLWVEGDTEELCVPIVLQAIYGYMPSTTVIVRVRSVDEVVSKKRVDDLVWDTYKRLSTAGGLVPLRARFLFDREQRQQSTIERFEKESAGAIKFLPRRTYENYLLDPCLLAAELNEEAARLGIDKTFSSLQIEGLLAENSARLFPKLPKADGRDEDWLRNVDAPTLLNNVFREALNLEYEKKRHSPALTRRLVVAGGPDCEELKNVIAERFS